MTGAAPQRRGLILGLVIAAGVLNYADRQIIAVLKPMLQQDLHWTDLDYGRITSVFQLASAAALVGSGWLVDRIGWRNANPLAVGAWSLAAMAHALVRTVSGFTVARAFLGGAEALGTPTAIKTIAAVYPQDERAFALGVMNAANTCGAVVTPLVIPLLAVRIGWANAFLITGGAGFFWVAAWFLTKAGREPSGSPPVIAQKGGSFVREVLGLRGTWAVAGAKVLSDQVWWLLLFWTPDLLHRLYHLDLVTVGGLVAVIYACAGAGSLAAGYLSTRLLKRGLGLGVVRKGVLLGLALLATPVALVLFVDNAFAATALLGLTLAAHQGFSVTIFALATDVAPPSRVGSVISVGALFGNLAGMVVLQTAGIVLNAGLGYAPLLGFASVSYLLATLWVHLWLPKIIPATGAGAGELLAAHP